MTEQTIDIFTFLDPDNEEHMLATYRYINSGRWPKDFIPDGIVFPDGWYEELLVRLAMCWIGSCCAGYS